MKDTQMLNFPSFCMFSYKKMNVYTYNSNYYSNCCDIHIYNEWSNKASVGVCIPKKSLFPTHIHAVCSMEIKAILMHGKVKQLNRKRNISCFSTSFSYQFTLIMLLKQQWMGFVWHSQDIYAIKYINSDKCLKLHWICAFLLFRWLFKNQTSPRIITTYFW